MTKTYQEGYKEKYSCDNNVPIERLHMHIAGHSVGPLPVFD